MLTKETLDRIVELGAEPSIEGGGDKEFAIAPSGFNVLDLSKYFPPKVIRTQVLVETPEAFNAYVMRFKTDNTMIFADISDEGASIMAVIDYHGPHDKAARMSHLVTYRTEATTEWENWMAANGSEHAKGQVAFATWLEDNLNLFNHPDAKPTAAELLELVLSLEGKQHVNFSSAHRLESGKNSIAYTEDIVLKGSTQPTTQAGSVELPRELLAAIEPFMGATPYAVRARFKYRIQSRALSLWFETISPHIIIRDSVKAVVKKIEDGTGMKAILGKVGALTP